MVDIIVYQYRDKTMKKLPSQWKEGIGKSMIMEGITRLHSNNKGLTDNNVNDNQQMISLFVILHQIVNHIILHLCLLGNMLHQMTQEFHMFYWFAWLPHGPLIPSIRALPFWFWFYASIMFFCYFFDDSIVLHVLCLPAQFYLRLPKQRWTITSRAHCARVSSSGNKTPSKLYRAKDFWIK